MMTLEEMVPSTSGLVVDAAVNSPELQSRLYSLGLYPGVRVDMLRLAPAGDPMQIRTGGTLLSIRRQEARLVSVEVIE